MVKIDNTMGDIKTGRQGEAVYQRKYGRQIRRTVSPKRTIPSEAQLAHRDLYRAALSWRKGLSLANRRYLDGYCISNGQVDSYHIPLPWSRFALKLYLEKVKFALSDIEEWTTEASYWYQEWFYDGYNYDAPIYGNNWLAQTFLTTVPYTLWKVVPIFGRNAGVSGEIIVSIRDTDGDKPIGGDLTSGTANAEDLSVCPGFTWTHIVIPDLEMLPNHRYAIVARFPTGTIGQSIHWAGRQGEPLYPYGKICSSNDAGASWTSYTTKDLWFHTGAVIRSEKKMSAILAVTHPALLTVAQKRGGLLVRGYDTLSSLDEKYLTGQVGIDVEKGDFIEAITLPGIKYCYEVT